MVKNHRKSDALEIQSIPIVHQYCYLGVIIDNSGSIEPHLQKIKKRADYLRASIRYYSNKLSVEN